MAGEKNHAAGDGNLGIIPYVCKFLKVNKQKYGQKN